MTIKSFKTDGLTAPFFSEKNLKFSKKIAASGKIFSKKGRKICKISRVQNWRFLTQNRKNTKIWCFCCTYSHIVRIPPSYEGVPFSDFGHFSG